MYYFNAWEAEHKKPFGAIKIGDLMEVNFKSDVPDSSVKFVIRRDFGARHEFDMQRKDENTFTSSVKFDVGKGLYFYHFEITEPGDWGNARRYYGATQDGGEGMLYHQENELRPYQLTVIEQADPAPDWYRESVFYQIFPDRFNNPLADGQVQAPKKNSFIYGSKEDEPFYVRNTDGSVARWDFYGGSFRGIIEKIPYLKELGVNSIYLNPIFEAQSSHRYDTSDYLKLDPMLGTEEDFRELIEKLHENQMRIVLDGVFSHVGDDSRYFNKYGTYGDAEGAAQSPTSPYFGWFKFTDYPNDYKSWWGFKNMPEVDKDNQSYRDFIYGKENSVLAKWNDFGVDGWRLDVADELPDSFIHGIRETLDSYSDKVLIGEVWEDASNKISYGQRRDYILGKSMHAVMNYPFRDLIIGYLNQQISAFDLAHRLMVLSENYPKDIFFNNLNNLGTHDTERILTMLGGQKEDLAVGMLFSLPGIPCIYYGDEAALTGGKDPYNRKYMPWKTKNQEIFNLYQSWTTKRLTEQSLKNGQMTTFYQENLFGLIRHTEHEAFVYLINPNQEDKVIGEVDNIRFLQTLNFLPELKDKLKNLKLAAQSAQEIKLNF